MQQLQTRSASPYFISPANDHDTPNQPCPRLHDASIDSRNDLAELIESRIVPGLLASQHERSLNEKIAASAPAALTDQNVEELTTLSLKDDPADALAYVLSLQAGGVAVETLYLELLAPAALRLGVLWEFDVIDFTATTLSTWRLQHILRVLSREFQRGDAVVDVGYRTLIMTAPGEQHSFGLVMLSEFFRNGGWSVSGGPGVLVEDAVKLIRNGWFDMLGFSLSCEAGLDALAAAITRLKSVSCNRAIRVMVGGNVFVEHPEFAARVGGIAAGMDARAAVSEATRLMNFDRHI